MPSVPDLPVWGGSGSNGSTVAVTRGSSEHWSEAKVSVVPTHTQIQTTHPTYITRLPSHLQHLRRRFVELCCGPNSIFGQPGPFTEGVDEHTGITEQDDGARPNFCSL